MTIIIFYVNIDMLDKKRKLELSYNKVKSFQKI